MLRLATNQVCFALASKKKAVAPTYQDPQTGATWSGRGRAPAWFGKNRDKFLIAQVHGLWLPR
ncbi:H-NS histone family protein [Ralstonia mannitolilytica]|nr:H-NS histone family protein [Ralstonia pickettii]MBU9580768.1 H-NS histone family protein [Ralstonia mannitolilytica]MBX9430592.1 H-NS histone family protein [Ralstonia pseudosolanacearum]QKL91129.1 H-NS histone family protein [Ralstonia solanacearum]QKL96205.1 H-NS histone family protein [Ralstonia solanacearum]